MPYRSFPGGFCGTPRSALQLAHEVEAILLAMDMGVRQSASVIIVERHKAAPVLE